MERSRSPPRPTAKPTSKLVMQGQGGETATSLTQPESILESSLHPERAWCMRPIVVGFRRPWAGAESRVPGSPQGAPCAHVGRHAQSTARLPPFGKSCFLNKGWCKLCRCSWGQAPRRGAEPGRQLHTSLGSRDPSAPGGKAGGGIGCHCWVFRIWLPTPGLLPWPNDPGQVS